MKRLIALLLALLLITPVLAEESFSPYDHHVMYTANGHYIVYDFPDIMLYIPIEWEDSATVVQTENGISFYQTGSYEKYQEQGLEGGGFLFELCSSEDESFRELPAYEYLGFSENVGLHFYLEVPSDYPAFVEEEGIRAEYDEMSGQIDEIVEMARISRSMHFYTDGIESTDPGRS